MASAYFTTRNQMLSQPFGRPPSAAPRVGHTDETAGAGTYVNATPLDENCCPFADTSTRRAPEPDDGGDAHSSCPTPTRRAAAVAPPRRADHDPG